MRKHLCKAPVDETPEAPAAQQKRELSPDGVSEESSEESSEEDFYDTLPVELKAAMKDAFCEADVRSYLQKIRDTLLELAPDSVEVGTEDPQTPAARAIG